MREIIKKKKNYDLSIVVPCYNEEKIIEKKIKNLLKLNYKGLKKIIIVDDCSTDNSYKIIKEYQKKYPKKILGIKTKKNSGTAAGAKNYGVKYVKTELIAFSDADSFISKKAINFMVGEFNNDKIGAVTSNVMVYNQENLLTKFQAIEYNIIAFTRKLLGFIGGIYVTNGPLSIYRKKAFDEVNGFDENNLTEDIEITWAIVKNKWEIGMSLCSKVYTIVPTKFKEWFKQRIRWNVGGIQTILKYKFNLFKKNKGMLGNFILPFFIFSWLFALFGLGFIIYRLINWIIVKYLYFSYSIAVQETIIRFNKFSLVVSILFIFGVIIFVLNALFTLLSYFYIKEENFKIEDIYILILFSFFYLLSYPFLLIISVFKFLKGERSW